jgi:hypothetical protein
VRLFLTWSDVLTTDDQAFELLHLCSVDSALFHVTFFTTSGIRGTDNAVFGCSNIIMRCRLVAWYREGRLSSRIDGEVVCSARDKPIRARNKLTARPIVWVIHLTIKHLGVREHIVKHIIPFEDI